MRFALPAVLFALVFPLAAAALADPSPTSTPMKLIPGGEFTMGDEGSDEMPLHRVKIDPFWLDEHEVTNAQFKAFCDATDNELPAFWNVVRFQCGDQWPEHPVIGVSRGEAQDYAEWVGKRLPTEAEWEFAARGGGEGRFGGDIDDLTPELANYKKSAYKAPAPVKSYPPNAYGVYDLIGNVREWTGDRHGTEVLATSLVPADGDLQVVEPQLNPTGPETGSLGVVKGGGWYSGSSCNAAHVRNGYPRGWGDFNVGFRCARDGD